MEASWERLGRFRGRSWASQMCLEAFLGCSVQPWRRFGIDPGRLRHVRKTMYKGNVEFLESLEHGLNVFLGRSAPSWKLLRPCSNVLEAIVGVLEAPRCFLKTSGAVLETILGVFDTS